MTWTGQRLLAAVGLVGALALGGCYDDGYYGGVGIGTGYYGGGYYDDYWGPGYYRPGYYGGWYDGFYYPGSGYYVYNRDGHRQRWSEGQRRYWEDRRGTWSNGAPRQTWRDRPGGGRDHPGGDGRWNRDWGASRNNSPGGAQAPQPGRGQQDMTTSRPGWNQGSAPRSRSDGGGGGRSRHGGWGRRD